MENTFFRAINSIPSSLTVRSPSRRLPAERYHTFSMVRGRSTTGVSSGVRPGGSSAGAIPQRQTATSNMMTCLTRAPPGNR